MPPCVLLMLLQLCIVNSEVQMYRAKYKFHPSKVSVLGDHTAVRDDKAFPYMAAVLYRNSYICAGALITEVWVITAADALFLTRETLRLLRVRLGSTNNKKGGSLHPVKLLEVHPYFDDVKPNFDVALMKLSRPVAFTYTLNPITVLMKQTSVKPSHFTVTAWSSFSFPSAVATDGNVVTGEARRWMHVSHLHEADAAACADAIESASRSDAAAQLMCLDPTVSTQPCERYGGAPVVFDGQLWGVMSSWTEEQCWTLAMPALAVRLSSIHVASWIKNITSGQPWTLPSTDTLP